MSALVLYKLGVNQCSNTLYLPAFLYPYVLILKQKPVGKNAKFILSILDVKIELYVNSLQIV